MLREHQRAILSDGFTVLESAAVQHNIRSVSNIYQNIALQELGTLLGLTTEQVESLASDMIMEGRLQGHIDQVRCGSTARMNLRRACLQIRFRGG
jgi:COP9 signalosome complex subunit 4